MFVGEFQVGPMHGLASFPLFALVNELGRCAYDVIDSRLLWFIKQACFAFRAGELCT